MPIPRGSTGPVAALPFSLINSSNGTGTTSHSWNDVGSGLTDELKVRLPGGAYGNATIARIVEVGGGDYEYQCDDTETATEGVISWYPNVAGHDINRGWDRIVEIASGGALHSGTAQAGAAQSITLASSASTTNSLYVDAVIRITGGTGAGQTNQVTGYVGATRVATVARAWAVEPDASSTYELLPAGSPLEAARLTWEGVEIEAGFMAAELLRGIVAVVLGQSEGWDAIRAAGGNGDAPYFAMDGTTARVTITYSTDGRPTVTINSLAA